MTATTAQGSACPQWCSHVEDVAEVDDGVIIITHWSKRDEVIGLCDPRIVQEVHGQAARVFIDVDPCGWSQLDSPEEARSLVASFTQRIEELIALAWPDD